MKVIEYGGENKSVIMLLHGGGLSWWNYREEAQILSEKYHVVLPVLDGHADSGRDFTSIEDNAAELIRYISARFHGAVLAIGGLSLGAQILVEMLSQKSDICRYAIIESALAVPMPMTRALVAPALGLSYGLIKKRWFSALQFKALKMRQGLFEDYYRDTCKITKQSMINFLRANSAYSIKPALARTSAKAVILAGGKEQGKIRISAGILHDAICGSSLSILDGFSHGELSLNYPKKYVETITRAIEG